MAANPSQNENAPSSARIETSPLVGYMRLVFAGIAIVAGLDKFFDFLTTWEQYLMPQIAHLVGVEPHTFMMGAGMIEIVIGTVVLFWPHIGGYVLAGWLAVIMINLLLHGAYYDVVLYDVGLLAGALVMARLGAHCRKPRVKEKC